MLKKAGGWIKKGRLFTGIILFAIAISLFVSEVQAAFPKPQGYVSDMAHIIPADTTDNLETLAQELERKTGAEMAIVTVPDLGGESLEPYAADLFQKWGIGKKDRDNGVLILVAVAERKIRIEVGYGLEGTIPDGQAGQIIREQITPAFKSGDYGAGIWRGAASIAQIIAQDAGVQLGLKELEDDGEGRPNNLFLLLFFIVFFAVLFPSLYSLYLYYSRGRGDHWSGGWGGFGGGGFGGGGFGGFGGGSSGGGGASGNW